LNVRAQQAIKSDFNIYVKGTLIYKNKSINHI